MSKVASLQDQIENILSANPFLAQQKLQLEAERGRIVLRGVVRSFYQKQMAQETLRYVAGVEEIENLLEVSWT